MNRQRKIGFMASLDFKTWKAESIIKALSSLGYVGVEWTLSHFNPRNKNEKELLELVELCHAYKMEISGVAVQQDYVTLDDNIRRDRIDLTKEVIKAASRVGIKVLNVYTGPAAEDPKALRIPKDITEEKAWNLVLEAYNEIVEVAEKEKIYLAVEAVFNQLCHDYYTLKELLNSINSKYLAVNMDPSHYYLYGNDIIWVVKKLSTKIKHVHIKDAIGKPGIMGVDFIFPLIGEGGIDWKGFINALDAIEYDGFLSIEFESFNYYNNILRRDPVKAAEISLELFKKVI